MTKVFLLFLARLTLVGKANELKKKKKIILTPNIPRSAHKQNIIIELDQLANM